MKLTYDKSGIARVRSGHRLAARHRGVFRHHARRGLLMLGAGALAVTALPALSNGSVRTAVSTSHSKKVKPDYAYYNGKTISLIWASAPGSTTIPNLLPLVDSYLHATINETFVSTGSGIVGLDQAYSAPPDGLTIGGTALPSMITHLIYTSDPFSFAIKKLAYITATKGSPEVMVACPGSGITSFNQYMTSTTLYTGIATPSVPVNLMMALMQQIYGRGGQILTGFTAATLAAGCLAGDGQVAWLTDAQVANSAGTGITAGLVPLLQTGKQPAGGGLAFLNGQIPDLQSLAKAHPPKTKAGKAAMAAIVQFESTIDPYLFLAAPANTPPQYVLALRKAFEWAMSQPASKANFTFNNTVTGYYDGSAILPYADSVLKKDLPIFQKYAAAN